MSGVYLSDEELDVLGDSHLALPHAAQLLYMRVLRRWMNYADGVVGRKRRISYQQIKEELECIPARGRMDNRVVLSKDQIKRLLVRLEDAGLIVSLHDKSSRSAMVFRLPLAACDLVRPREYRHDSATNTTPRHNPDNTGADGGNTATDAPHELRHTSELPSNNSLSAAQDKKFSMSFNWSVFDADQFAENCAMENLCWDAVGSDVKEVIRVEFVRFEMMSGRELDQAGWEHRFLASVRYAAKQGMVPRVGGVGMDQVRV
ncbi:MAG: hypothetical protein ACPGF7_13635 [Pontibacterium sp.]